MQTIIIIDQDTESNSQLEKILAPSYRVIEASDNKRGIEFVRSALPDLIIVGLEIEDLESFDALKQIQKDPMIKDTPVLGLFRDADRKFIIDSSRKYGIVEHIFKPVNKYELIPKIKELIEVSKLNQSSKIISRKNHIVVERPLDNLIKISFKSGLKKYVLPEIKTVLNPEFLKALSTKECCLDIRDLPELTKEEMGILDKIIPIFGNKKISIIAGKHLGTIISSSNLEERTHIFMSLEDFVVFIKNKS
ncbi:MAG: response regulator [Leptospiraceae bacterium]|nr:response regulator [Leptospiraceae bacterium]